MVFDISIMERNTTLVCLSRLEQLPEELQDQIYRYAVIESEPIEIEVRMIPSGEDLWAPGDQAAMEDVAFPPASPSIAQVSRIVRALVLPIFFGENTFTMNSQQHNDPGIDVAGCVIPSLRPWLDMVHRYTGGSATIGLWGQTPVFRAKVLLLASMTKRHRITYEYKTPFPSDGWRAAHLELLAKVIRKERGVTLEQLFRACHDDLKEALDKLDEVELGGEDSDEVIFFSYID